MKKLLFPAMALLFLFCYSQSTAQKRGKRKRTQSIDVIGVYAHWQTSMCSQNCENIDVGMYELTETLASLPEWTTHETVWVNGEFVTVQELPTIAGPNAKGANKDELITVRKIRTKKHKKIAFPDVTIKKKEYEKFQNGETFDVKLTFENPTDKSLEAKCKVNNESFVPVILSAGERKSITFTMPSSDYDSYDFLVVNKNYSSDESQQSMADAEKKGVVIFVKKYVRISDLMEK